MIIKLPDYKKIASEVKRQKIEVLEEEVKETLDWVRKSRAKFSQKLGPCQKGDWVEIEYSSPQLENGLKRKDAFFLGKGQLIPGFEDNIEGMEIGEERRLVLTIPQNHYRKDLAGKKVEFSVKMCSVQRAEFPELTDEFARSLGKFENLEALKKSVREGIYLEKEEIESKRVRAEILSKIVQAAEIKPPKELVEKEKNLMLENLKKDIANNLKIPFEKYLQRLNKTQKEIEEYYYQQAENLVKGFLVIKEISKRENIEVKEEEIEEEINKILKHYPSIETAQKELDLEKLKLYIKDRIEAEKTLEFLESFVV